MKKQLFAKNYLMFLSVLLIPIIVLGTLIFIVQLDYVEQLVRVRNEVIIDSSAREIEQMLIQLNAININLSSRRLAAKKVEAALNNPGPGISLEDYELVKTVASMLLSIVSSNSYIESIYIYTPNNNNLFIDSTTGISNISLHPDSGWYESYTNTPEDMKTWYEKRDIHQYKFEKKPTPILSIYQRISSPHISGGVLVLNIYADEINKVLTRASNAADMDFFLVDQTNNILFSNQGVRTYSSRELDEIVENQSNSYTINTLRARKLVNKLPSTFFPEWTYVSIADAGSLWQLPNTVFLFTILAILGCLLAGAYLAYRLTRRTIRYLDQILEIIEAASQNRKLPDLPDRSDIYGYILTNIVRTFADYRQVSAQLIEKDYQIQSLAYSALHSQIWPHFLYNTLETIKWTTMDLTQGSNDASVMLENLSGILRYSFTNTLDSVPVEKEIEMMRRYFRIQKQRFRNFFKIVWQIDKSLMNARILKFLLQPIVENSFQHGLKNGNDSISIKITVFRRDNRLIIQVTDTGAGMSREKLAAAREYMNNKVQSGRPHIGLANTHQRIRLFYGEDYGLTINSVKNIGTMVRIQLPIVLPDPEPPKALK